MVPFKKKKQSLSFQNYGKEVKQQSFKLIYQYNDEKSHSL